MEFLGFGHYFSRVFCSVVYNQGGGLGGDGEGLMWCGQLYQGNYLTRDTYIF